MRKIIAYSVEDIIKNETIPSSSSGGICYVKIDCRGRYMELMGESKKIFDSLQ